jgi:hypothetical protein
MSQNLAICMSRAMSIYFLSWVKQFGSEKNFDLIISNGDILPEEYKAFLEKYRIKCVDKFFAQKQNYETIVLQPYEGFGAHKQMLEQYSFKKITYFSDAFRNGMFSFPKLDNRTTELVYFGFELFESAFNDNLNSGQREITRSIVSIDYIKKTWLDLTKLYPLQNRDLSMGKRDLLIAMRHWGSSPQYTFKSDNLEFYLEEEIDSQTGVSRIIYRRHPWMASDLNSKIKSHLVHKSKFSRNVELVAWEELVSENIEFPELTSPEAQFWLTDYELGKFFGFDGSLNTLVKLRCPQVEIIYPKKQIYKKYFEYQKSINLVEEQINWQRDLASQLSVSAELTKVKVSTSGQFYEKLISEIGYQERDALTQERDALTQERDALTQERDALTQERDALTDSTIWRFTGPLRKILSILKN